MTRMGTDKNQAYLFEMLEIPVSIGGIRGWGFFGSCAPRRLRGQHSRALSRQAQVVAAEVPVTVRSWPALSLMYQVLLVLVVP